MKLDRKIAVITGASKGIGRQVALTFAKEGATLVLLARDHEKLKEVASEIERRGGQTLSIPTDVTKETEVVKAVDEAIDRYGKIDILVTCAGIPGPTVPLMSLEVTDWEGVLDTNLKGVFLCCKAVIPHMKKQGRGHIVTISGTAGKAGYPLRAPYCVSKWGVIGLTLTVALEVGRENIYVNCVCPGPVTGERLDFVIEKRARATGCSFEDVKAELLEQTAMRKFVSATEVARTILFLCSEEATGITGQVITVAATP